MWPSRAFTFIDNHDTGSTLNHWPFPSQVSAICVDQGAGIGNSIATDHVCRTVQFIPLGYAYILTHPGTPTVFYDHFYQVWNNGPI